MRSMVRQTHKILLCLCLIFLIPGGATALDVTLPWSKTFDGSYDYSSEVWLESDCGAGTGAGHTWRNTSEYCWSGGCADFKAPSANCAGGNTNGGISAYGTIAWPTQESGTTVLNVRFLIKIGANYANDIDDYYGSSSQHENKLVDVKASGGTRHGLVCLHRTEIGGGGSDEYIALGFWASGSVPTFNNGTGSQVWIENAAFKIDVNDNDQNTGVWLNVEHQINITDETQTLRITETDGTVTEFSGSSLESTGNMGTFYIGGYFNAYMPTEQQSNHLIFDEISIARNMSEGSYIGPPNGFLAAGGTLTQTAGGTLTQTAGGTMTQQ